MLEKQHLHSLIEQLRESELAASVRYLEFLVSREASVEPELLARIEFARANPSPGISHQDALREFGHFELRMGSRGIRAGG